MIIYTNGDSFTAGDGLISVFWDTYPGNISNNNTLADQERSRKWASTKATEFSRDRHTVKSEFKLYKEQNKQRAWPAKLGQLLDVQVINNALGGSGIVSIGMNTMQDLISLSNEGVIPDQVIIGLTGMARLSLVDDKAWWDEQKWMITAHPGHQEEIPDRYLEYANNFWRSHSDDEIMLFFLYNCLSIRNFVKVHIGKFPIFVKTINEFDHWNSIVNNSNIPMVKKLWQLLEFDQLVHEPSIFTVKPVTEKLACGHLLEDSHDAFSKYLKERYFNYELQPSKNS